MTDYARSPKAQQLRGFLDDADTEPCGMCDRCTGTSLGITFDPQARAEGGRVPAVTDHRHRAPRGCR